MNDQEQGPFGNDHTLKRLAEIVGLTNEEIADAAAKRPDERADWLVDKAQERFAGAEAEINRYESALADCDARLTGTQAALKLLRISLEQKAAECFKERREAAGLGITLSNIRERGRQLQSQGDPLGFLGERDRERVEGLIEWVLTGREW